MATNDIQQMAIGWYRAFEDCLPDVHLCCPKIDDDDAASYDEADVSDDGGLSAEEKKRRIDEGMDRLDNVYNLSILMIWPKELTGGWLDNWTQAVESCLTRCDLCVRNWHKHRDVYLKGL